MSIVAPAGRALPGARLLSRALRPFNRRVPAQQHWQLDEEATVRCYAEDRLWVPVLRPARARWLEVALVVDAAPSMLLWQPVVREFRWILERQGAFRDVREWRLETMSPRPGLHRGSNALPRRPEELVEPAGRRLVLVVSDCVAPAWQQPQLARWLELWGRHQPVAIVQVLPARLWSATGLGRLPGIRLTAREPGLPNRRLTTVLRRRRAIGRRPAGVPVPVVSLDPGELLDWAAMVAGEGTRPATAFFFPSTGPTFEAETSPSPAAETPDAAVARFQAEATQTAFRLACLLAAAPLRLPVMRLVQQVMLPGSAQGHLAEVFLSGLIHRVTPPDAPVAPDELDFDFRPGVRERLLASTYASEALAVLRAVSRYFDEHLGTGLGFEALLANPATATTGTRPEEASRVFARVSAQVLGRLGRRYAEAARRLADASSISVDESGPGSERPEDRPAAPAAPDLSDTLGTEPGDELRHARSLLVNVLAARLAQRRDQEEPRQEGAAATSRSTQPAHAVPRRGLAGSVLLWIDDHPENNRNEASLLEQRGARIIHVRTSNDALGLLGKGGIDAILSDLARPEGPFAGLELLDRVRQHGFFQPFAIYAGPEAERYQEQVAVRLGQVSTHRFDKLLEVLEAALERDAPSPACLPPQRVEAVAELVRQWGGDPALVRELNQQPDQPGTWTKLWSGLEAASQLERVVQMIAVATGLPYVQLFRFEDHRLWLSAEWVKSGLKRYAEASLSGIIGRAARTGSTVHLPDVRTDTAYIPAEPTTCSELAVPVRDPTSGGVRAVLNLESPLVQAFGALQIRWLESLAASLGAVIAGQTAQAASVAAGETVMLHVVVEVPDELEAGHAAQLQVRLSREPLPTPHAFSASHAAPAQADRELVLEFTPQIGFALAGDAHVEAKFPEAGHPAAYVFEIKPTQVGDGEILVRIRQGAQPLASLQVRTSIVSGRTRPPVQRAQEATVVEAAPGPQPRHELSIIEIERGGQRRYQYSLRSPWLGVLGNWESKPFTGNLEDFLRAVYGDIESRYAGSHEDHERFDQELRALGGSLWDELFPEELQAILWQHRDRIDSLLLVDEGLVPWELVHLKEPHGPLGSETRFLAQMGLVRWLPHAPAPPTSLRARPNRCRYVIPRYPHPEYALPEASLEAQFLERHFQATPVEPHAKPVRELLTTAGGLDLLHFAGHGVADSTSLLGAEVLLQGRVEGSTYVSESLRETTVAQLADLGGKEGNRPMIVMDVCAAGRPVGQSLGMRGFARAFLNAGAGVFVAPNWSVGDAPGRSFVEAFYRHLLQGRTLAQATVAAREAARAAGGPTWLAYSVYGHPEARLVREETDVRPKEEALP
jgi:putative methionine-R-sulfoxide reductase with GAF domain